MTHFLRILQAVALLFLCIVLWDAHKFIRDLRVSLRETDIVLGNVNQASSDLSGIAKTANSAMGAEVGRINASTLELQKTEASARLLIVRTNESLNGGPNVPGLLPQATTALSSANSLSIGTLGRVDRLADQLEPAITDLRRSSASLADVAGDPNIPVTLAKIRETTENTDRAMGQLADIVTDGRQVADKARETYLKPVNLWWGLVRTLLPLAGSAAQVVK